MKLERNLNMSILYIVTAWILISPSLLALIFNFFSVPVQLIAIKDLAILLALFVIFLRKKFTENTIAFASLCAPFLALVIMNFLFFDASPEAKIASTRQLILPYLSALLGLSIINGVAHRLRDFCKFVLFFGIFIAVFGIFERVTYLWGSSGVLRSFFEAKSIEVWSFGYPFIFIEPVAGVREFAEVEGLLRASSFLLDPINFGHHCVTVITAMIYLRANGDFRGGAFATFLCAFILLTAMAMSLSKGAAIQLVLIALLSSALLNIPARLLIACGTAFAGAGFAVSIPGFAVRATSYMNLATLLSPFGLGIGATGNYAMMVSGVSSEIQDSFVAALVGQLGVIGALFWVLPFVSFLLPFFSRGSVLFNTALICQFSVSAMSENAFNIGSTFVMIVLWAGAQRPFYVENVT